MMQTFTDKFYEIVREAGAFITDRVITADGIDIYDTEDTIYERLLSDKYEGIYSLYELVRVYNEGEVIYVKGVDTNDGSEYDFTLSDLSPDIICEIADKIKE